MRLVLDDCGHVAVDCQTVAIVQSYFLFFPPVNDVEESEGLPSLDKSGWYSQGNWPHLHELLRTMTGKPDPKVCRQLDILAERAVRLLAVVLFEVDSNFGFWQRLKEMRAS